jgi:glycosyltransferase involved in cell wall biosynthesis
VERSLRICHIIESAAAGSAMIMAGNAKGAAAQGHEVHVIYSPGREDAAIIAALRAGGCASVTPVAMRRAIGPWDAVDGLRLRAAVKALGPIDVIHAHSSKAGALTRLFCRMRRPAIVYSPHGFYSMTDEAPGYIGPVERVLSHRCEKIVAVSTAERDHGLSLGIAPEKLRVVENGIPPFETLTRTDARAELGLAPDAFVVGFVGRLSSQKNPVDALRAIDAVRESSAVLAMIGDGDEMPAVRDQAAHGSRVRLLGGRDARPLYRAFDTLLCTSRFEGMPVSFLEALACGVPIVSYPVGGSKELVIDGVTGFRTASTPMAAAEAIDGIAAMPAAERHALSAGALELGKAHSEEAMCAQTLQVYAEAIAARG